MMETISGTLDDYDLMTEGEHVGRYAARISGTPYLVMPHVDAFLTRLQKSILVNANLNKDGWISKIQAQKKNSALPAKKPEPTAQEITSEQTAYNEAAKRQKAGFNTPTPATPAPGLKTVIGQIQAVNPDKRGIAVKDVGGVIHSLYWLPGTDSAFAHLKQWWFVKVTAEVVGDEWRAISQTKADKPEGWKSAGGYGGKGNYQPRNDKAMIVESAFKSCVELFDPERDGKGKSFEDNVERVRIQADRIADWMMTKAGV